jgi:hypothetical protein
MEINYKYMKFEKIDDTFYHIYNDNLEEIGYLELTRVGAWRSWCLFLDEGCYLSAGCLDEVRRKMKELNATANKPKTQ